MMREITFGSLDKRHLMLRWRVPDNFCRWRGYDWRLSPLLLLNPLRWYRAARYRWNWSLQWRWNSHGTHRCYCPEGHEFDGRIVLCGFGVVWFYHRFTGRVPCVCDEAFEEWREEQQAFIRELKETGQEVMPE